MKFESPLGEGKREGRGAWKMKRRHRRSALWNAYFWPTIIDKRPAEFAEKLLSNLLEYLIRFIYRVTDRFIFLVVKDDFKRFNEFSTCYFACISLKIHFSIETGANFEENSFYFILPDALSANSISKTKYAWIYTDQINWTKIESPMDCIDKVADFVETSGLYTSTVAVCKTESKLFRA